MKVAEKAEAHVTNEEVDEDEVLTGAFRSMGRTTGVLVVPDLDTSQVRGIGYDIVENEEYQNGEIIKVYFKLTSNNVGFRYYRIPDKYRAFVENRMSNLSIAPPHAIGGRE